MESVSRVSTSFGTLVKRHRGLQGLSQADLADQVDGLVETDIARLERGEAGIPSRTILHDLGVALAVPLPVLLAASGWLEAQAARSTLLRQFRPSAVDCVPTLDQALVMHEELAALQDLQWELKAWLEDLAVRINRSRFQG
jgi:transcriptional regulator with XRE-family HTH domain